MYILNFNGLMIFNGLQLQKYCPTDSKMSVIPSQFAAYFFLYSFMFIQLHL